MMRRFRFDKPWRALWQIAVSDLLLGTVLLVLAAALLLAAWLPQTSAENPTTDVVWQGEMQRRFGGIAWLDTIRPPLQTIGAFHVADAVGFRLLSALLAVALLARLVDSVEAFWKAWRRDTPQESDAQEGAARAERPWPWGELGSIGIYLGGLTILLGAAITNAWGWRIAPLALAPGQSVPLGHGSDLTLRLETLDEAGQRGGAEIWRGGETFIAASELEAGRPLVGGGVGVYLVGSGTGVRVQATLSDTQVLELETGPDTTAQENLTLTFTEEEPRHLIGVPEADLVLMLQQPEPEQSGAPPQIQVFEAGSGEFILEQTAPENTTLTVRDVTISLTPIPFARIQVVRDQGAFWTQLGVSGLVAGMLLRGFDPVRRLWRRRQADTGVPSEDADRAPLPEMSTPRADPPQTGGR